MDRSLIDDFREKVNDHDMVWKIYHDRNGKNQWSIICSAMDWIDVVVEEIDTSKLCSKNDNASSIKMMTFINCVDVLWESIQQLHRVIFDPRSIPFQDDSSVFTDKLYESSDNEYFKTIRACFSAHPVNLNDRFNGEGKEQRYASWSGGGFGCKDFSVMLYSNTKGMESIILDISFSELITFAEKRYNYLQVLVGEIDKQISQYNRSWKEKQIPKVDAPLKQIEILIEENEKRLQNDYYRYELQKLHIVFCTPIHNMQNCEVVQAYRNASLNAIPDLFENIQEMRLEEIHSQYLLDIDCPPEYHYSFSKLSEAMYGGVPFIVTLGGIIDYLADVVDLLDCISLQEKYVVTIAGFYMRKKIEMSKLANESSERN